MWWVTINVAHDISATRADVMSTTRRAVTGSRAARCSSSRSKAGAPSAAMINVRLWRCPADRSPTGSCKRSSRPSPSVARRSRMVCRRVRLLARPSPRRWPRLIARAMLSSTLSSGAVPTRGSSRTRAINPARLWSAQRLTLRPVSVTVPIVGRAVPAMTWTRLLLPAPFDPTTVTNSPTNGEIDSVECPHLVGATAVVHQMNSLEPDHGAHGAHETLT